LKIFFDRTPAAHFVTIACVPFCKSSRDSKFNRRRFNSGSVVSIGDKAASAQDVVR